MVFDQRLWWVIKPEPVRHVLVIETRMAVLSRLNTRPWRESVFPLKRPARLDTKALLIGPYPLQRTSSVTIGQLPSKGHAKAFFNPEETRNLKLHFVESSPFSAGRISSLENCVQEDLSRSTEI